MKEMSISKMESINGGFPWASFAAGVGCAYGLATSVTGFGVVIALAFCGTAFLYD